MTIDNELGTMEAKERKPPTSPFEKKEREKSLNDIKIEAEEAYTAFQASVQNLNEQSIPAKTADTGIEQWTKSQLDTIKQEAAQEKVAFDAYIKELETPSETTKNSAEKEIDLTKERLKKPEQRVQEMFDKLKESSERFKESPLRGRASLIADGGHIENQQLDIIDVSDDQNNPHLKVQFKLTSSAYEQAISGLKAQDEQKQNEEYVPPDTIGFKKKNGTEEIPLAEAWKFEQDGIIIKIAKGTREGMDVRSSLGLVQIEIPKGMITDPNAFMTKIEGILSNQFQIQDGLTAPDTESDINYREKRLAWNRKQNTDELNPETVKNLQREEVFEGYHALVQKDYHKELLKENDFAIYHEHMGDLETIPLVIKSGGLFSTAERRHRGLIVNGISSDSDLISGGGDSVFTRIVSEGGLNTNDQEEKLRSSYVSYVFEQDLLDRTDVYSYAEDQYGSTDPSIYDQQRLSIKELFDEQKTNGYRDNNEQMFRTGIHESKIKAVACTDIGRKSWIKDQLKEMGIEQLVDKSSDQLAELDNESLIKLLEEQSVNLSQDALQKGKELPKKWAVNKFKEYGITAIDGKTPEELQAMPREDLKKLLLDVQSRNYAESAQLKGRTLTELVSTLKDGDMRSSLIRTFKEQGVQELHGKSIEEFVIYASTAKDLINMVSTKPKQEKNQPEVPSPELPFGVIPESNISSNYLSDLKELNEGLEFSPMLALERLHEDVIKYDDMSGVTKADIEAIGKISVEAQGFKFSDSQDREKAKKLSQELLNNLKQRIKK